MERFIVVKIRLYPDTKARAISFLRDINNKGVTRWRKKEEELYRLAKTPWGMMVIYIPQDWVEYII